MFQALAHASCITKAHSTPAPPSGCISVGGLLPSIPHLLGAGAHAHVNAHAHPTWHRSIFQFHAPMVFSLSEGRRRGPRGVFCFEMRLLANDSPAIWPRLYASTCLGAGHGEWLWPRPPVPRVSGRPGQAFGMCGLFRPVALHQTHQSQGGCSSSHASFASVSVSRMSVWDTRSAGTSF